jgi:hypothetical protein
MKMIRRPVPGTRWKWAWFILVKLFEALSSVRVVTDVVCFMFVHIALILEGEGTARPCAVEMCCSLVDEGAGGHPARLRRTVPLEAIADKLLVLLVEIFMSHDIRCAGVHFGAAAMKAMVVSTFPIEMAESKLGRAVIGGGEPHEAVSQ